MSGDTIIPNNLTIPQEGTRAYTRVGDQHLLEAEDSKKKRLPRKPLVQGEDWLAVVDGVCFAGGARRALAHRTPLQRVRLVFPLLDGRAKPAGITNLVIDREAAIKVLFGVLGLRLEPRVV